MEVNIYFANRPEKNEKSHRFDGLSSTKDTVHRVSMKRVMDGK